MKTFINLLLGIFLLFIAEDCNNTEAATQNNTGSSIEVTGTIEKQGITSYQYGTHTLTTEEDFFAVKSESVDLDKYLNLKVTAKATKIEGYPVDGGPEFLLILSVE